MSDFFTNHQQELIYSVIVLSILLIIRFAMRQGVKRVGKRSDISEARVQLIERYVNVVLFLIAIFVAMIIWKVNLEELGLIFSSVFAVLGVALFAQWSILSNVTSGVIMYFSFPYKIGHRIKIHDKDFPIEGLIEDIKAFHIHLRTDEGELLTYPNNMLLQKGVSVLDS